MDILTALNGKALRAYRAQDSELLNRRVENLDIDSKVQITLVRVPAGEFIMGNPDGPADEGPPCRVRIERPFWISKQILTNEQFNFATKVIHVPVTFVTSLLQATE